MFLKIERLGVRCFADAALFLPEQNRESEGRVLVLSLFGRPGEVRANTATLLKGDTLTVRGEGRRAMTIAPPVGIQLRSFSQSLGRGLLQKVVYAPPYFGENTNLARKRVVFGDDVERGFEFLTSVVSTPLKEDWASWLMKESQAVKTEPLVGFGSLGKNGPDLTTARLLCLNDQGMGMDEFDTFLDQTVLSALEEGTIA